MLSRSLSLLGAAATIGAIGAASAVAAPKTAITYINGSNVYLVNADGSGAHAMTTDGTEADRYRRPRVAPDGSVWALRSWDLVHVGPDGHKVGTIHLTPPKDSKGRDLQYVPEWLDLSSDGKRAVWSVLNWNCSEGPDIEDCYGDAISGVVDLGSGQQSAPVNGLTETSFLDDQHLVGIDEDSLGDVRVAGLTGPVSLWYNDRDAFPSEIGTPEQPAVNADQSRYATLRVVQQKGYGVFVYNIAKAGTPSGLATPSQHLCVINNIDVTHAGPSWSPDGHSLVVAQKDGLAAYDFSKVATGADCTSKVKFTPIADKPAIEPDWGIVPGTVPDPPVDHGHETPAPPAPPAPSTPVPTPSVTTPVKTTPGPKAAASAKLSISTQKLSAILKSGLKVKLTGLPAGKTKVVVKAKGKVVGTATVKVPASGTASLKVKLSRAGRKALKRVRSTTLTVTAGAVTASVKVKR